MFCPKCVRTTLIVLAAVTLASCAFDLLAQETAPTPHVITSEALGQERHFTVHVPASYNTQSASYPVLYLLDGEHNADFTEAVVDFLAGNGRIPELIVVAVPSGATRGADYRPEFVEMGGSAGGANLFLAHLADELIPFIEDNYRAAPFRILSGHSMGGLFTTYALTKRSDLFRGFISQSPYLDGEMGTQMLDHVTESIDGIVGDAVYYMNVGDEPNLSANLERLGDLLNQAPDGLRVVAHSDPTQTHMTTRLLGQYAGLENTFAEWPVPATALAAEGAAALEAHIASLSTAYGYPVLLNESAFQQATQSAIGQGNFDGAVAFAQLYAAQYANSPVPHFLGGVALARSGQLAPAAEAVARAIELYEANPTPELEGMYQTMKQVQQQIAGALG